MCGIVGYLNIDREDLASSMIDTLIHRGPDDRGVFFDKSIRLGLGHSRLSILDISMLGHQPMWSSDRQICLVFNGEIYNHLEIRERLKGKYTFKSTSDTETIIYAYQEYGIDCFRMFEGMFALAIYDYQSSKLILCRDRLGKKPLYWFFDGEHFVFASELKALMKSEYFKKEIDIDSVSKYLIYDYVPTPFTIWKDVFKLEPATYMIFDGKRIEKNKFWDINKPIVNETFDNAKKNIDSMLDRSVSSRLISDVPLGIFLSGGLDSSTILYYAKRHRDSIDTFSIGFNEKSFDESAYAKEVSRYFGTNHHEKIFSEKECASSIFEVLSKVDEPVADASIIPTYLLSKFTSEYVTVSLGGE
jgi:asparagine synthase (glutamine-hydrolysing)